MRYVTLYTDNLLSISAIQLFCSGIVWTCTAQFEYGDQCIDVKCMKIIIPEIKCITHFEKQATQKWEVQASYQGIHLIAL